MNNIMAAINDKILNPLIILLFALAAIYFLFGVGKVLFYADDPKKQTEGKSAILYGTIGLFIMMAVGGILNVISNILGGLPKM